MLTSWLHTCHSLPHFICAFFWTIHLGRILQERVAGLEKSSEDLAQHHRKEVSRLEAALAGAEAAKKNLGEQQAQHSTAGESDLQAAQTAQAEADARASSLQRQIDTLRAQAAASRSGLQEEANSLKVIGGR